MAVRERMADDLQVLLRAQPGQHKRQLLAGLEGRGWTGLSSADVNGVLYQHGSIFASDRATPPRWRLAAVEQGSLATVARPALPASSTSGRFREVGYAGEPPRSWQTEALAAWSRR